MSVEVCDSTFSPVANTPAHQPELLEGEKSLKQLLLPRAAKGTCGASAASGDENHPTISRRFCHKVQLSVRPSVLQEHMREGLRSTLETNVFPTAVAPLQ